MSISPSDEIRFWMGITDQTVEWYQELSGAGSGGLWTNKGTIESCDDNAARWRKMIRNEDRTRHGTGMQVREIELISRFLSDGIRGFVDEACCRYSGKSRGEIIGHYHFPGHTCERSGKSEPSFCITDPS